MCHVLIIEDEALVAMLIEDTLEAAGATSFDFASTEDEAVALARANPPSFITADVTLRCGRGPQAVNRIRSELGPVATVVISGNVHPETPDPPPCPVLAKPFSPDQLTATFRAMAPL